jgi:hypothetical protein
MITIQDHVLFPHLANWDVPPETSRRWETNISTALPGGEQRQGMRVLPRRRLTFSLLARTADERARMDARIDAAKKSALACAPYFGRGTELGEALAVGADTLTLQAPLGWTWQAGDQAILIVNDTRFDCLQISAVAGDVLHLESLPENDWPLGAMVWPLFFGKFSIDDLTELSSWHQVAPITLTQTEAERNASVGVVAGPEAGIGGWKIGTTLIVS